MARWPSLKMAVNHWGLARKTPENPAGGAAVAMVTEAERPELAQAAVAPVRAAARRYAAPEQAAEQEHAEIEQTTER